jgi:uncharacterized protein YoxC
VKIKEFRIHRYGPLGESGVVKLGQFNLFYGNNEDGKTLTLEALVHFLLGKRAKIFPGIERVDHRPEGYLLLQDENGNEYKLPEAGDVSQIFGITAEEYRNLFIIRNSDLTISRESEFYDAISERLTGLHTGTIQKIKQKIRDIAGFTPTMDVVNTRESHYLKKRLLQAEELREECAALLAEAEENEYEQLEEQLVTLQKKIQGAEKHIALLNKARQRERYQKGRKQLDKLYQAQNTLTTLPPLNEDTYLTWQRLESQIETREKELQKAQHQAQNLEEELSEVQKQLLARLNQFEPLRNRKYAADSQLRPILQQIAEYQKSNARLLSSRPFFLTTIAISLLVSLLSLGGVIWQPGNTPMLIVAASSATATFLLALFYYLRFVDPSGEYQVRKTEALALGKKLQLPAENIDQLTESLTALERDFQMRQMEIQEIENRVHFLEKAYQNIRIERINELSRNLEELRKAVAEIRNSAKVASPQAYHEKLKQRQAMEAQIHQAETVLENMFGSAEGDLSAKIEYWENALEDLQRFVYEAPSVAFDEKALEQISDEREQLLEQTQQTQQRLIEFRSRLADLERRIYEVVMPEEERFPSRTLNDLKALQTMLEDFIAAHRKTQEKARKAIAIFEVMEREEREKIRDLFGEGSRISTIYSEITDALYPAVYYDADEGGIRILRSDGKQLQPSWLSSGAYDQLYFAVRIALGEQLLKSEKGFFILDDPFLKSDSKRLRQQLEMLVELSRQGWQILYFSAKDEIVSTLSHHIDSGAISLQEAPQIDYKIPR